MQVGSPILEEAQPLAEASQNVRRVVVPVGGTDREFLAQEHAAEFAAALGIGVHAIHVHEDPDDAPDDVFNFFEQQCARWQVPCSSAVIAGDDVAAELLQELGPLDLVVIGTRRLGGRYHLDSVTERLIHDAPCAVQVVRIQ